MKKKRKYKTTGNEKINETEKQKNKKGEGVRVRETPSLKEKIK